MAAFLLIVLLMHLAKLKPFGSRVVLVLMALVAPFAVFLLEAGWAVDEVGRQPWIIYNVMTVSQAANQSPSIVYFSALIVIIYAAIAPITYFVIRRLFANRPLDKELTK